MYNITCIVDKKFNGFLKINILRRKMIFLLNVDLYIVDCLLLIEILRRLLCLEFGLIATDQVMLTANNPTKTQRKAEA